MICIFSLIGYLIASVSVYAHTNIQIGGFYTKHHEGQHKYEASGISLETNLLNENGCRFHSLFNYDPDSDRPYFFLRNETTYLFDLHPFLFGPLFGMQHSSQVLSREGLKVYSLNRVFLPIGFEWKWEKEKVKLGLKCSHLIPVASTYYENDSKTVKGMHYDLFNRWEIRGNIATRLGDILGLKFEGSLMRGYKKKMYEASARAMMTFSF